jgi:hypothetical protein
MAKIKDNYVMTGVSGAVGELLIFRVRGGKTFIAKFPKPSSVPPTVKLKSVRSNFASCIAYGKRAMKDPATKALYRAAAKGGQTAFNKATSDALNPPKVNDIKVDIEKNMILIDATDDFMVTGVSVTIHDALENLLEEGNAAKQENEMEWIYSMNNSILPANSKITAIAVDMPKNKASLSIVVNQKTT